MRIVYLLLLFFLVGSVRVQEESGSLEPQTICTNCDVTNSDCKLTNWGAWSPCTGEFCSGPFTHKRVRSVAQYPTGTGTHCDLYTFEEVDQCDPADPIQLAQINTLKAKLCPVHCVQSEWRPKTGVCSKTEADCPVWDANRVIYGEMVIVRDVITPSANGGDLCGPAEDKQKCSVLCNYDCQWTDWQSLPGECELKCIPETGTNLQQQVRYIARPANGGAACTGSSSRFFGPCETKNLPTCCPGCVEQAPWTDFSPCTVTCGHGTQTRTRKMALPTWSVNPDKYCTNSMPDCGDSSQTIDCCNAECPVDCTCGEWAAWSACASMETDTGLQCGQGKKFRYRNCLAPMYGGNTMFAGTPCTVTEDEAMCTMLGCPQNCEVSEWGAWEDCPKECGKRKTVHRFREVLKSPESGGSDCPPLEEEYECTCTPCPVPCVLGPWTPYGACDQPCGPGKQCRSRDILTHDAYGGEKCDITQSCRDCFIDPSGKVTIDGKEEPANKPCSEDCKVSQWKDWGPCSKSCTPEEKGASTPGTRKRFRTVDHPVVFEGQQCPHTEEEAWCNTQCCPVNMELEGWGGWSVCSVSCGGGFQRRTRGVAVYPRCGGKTIDEPLYQIQKCNEQCCPKTCLYHPYSLYSSCKDITADALKQLFANHDSGAIEELEDVNCTTTEHEGDTAYGAQYRTRMVRRQDCNNGCTATYDVIDCAVTCPVDCIMDQWENWGDCDTSERQCGWSFRKRTRKILQEPGKDDIGSACPCELEREPCYLGKCCDDCELTPWTDFEPCTATCGGGTQVRRRFVNVSTALCPCDKQGVWDMKPCNTQPCPQRCEMNTWGEWSSCSADCGEGYHHHTRTVKERGIGQCDWDYEEDICNGPPCTQPCIYSDYTEWTPCPVTCLPDGYTGEKPKQHRLSTRISGAVNDDCLQPVKTESKECNVPTCDRMCSVTGWDKWSDCSVKKNGWGKETRQRYVITPATGNEVCPNLLEWRYCYAPPTENPCKWSDWGSWGSCSATCKDSTGSGEELPAQQTRHRFLVSSPTTTGREEAHTVIDPETGLPVEVKASVTLDATCSDEGDMDWKPCVGLPYCPIDCVMHKWSAWTECTYPGIRYRYRSVKHKENYGGQRCPPCLEESDHCVIRDNNDNPEKCEAGPCLAQIQQEWERKQVETQGLP